MMTTSVFKRNDFEAYEQLFGLPTTEREGRMPQKRIMRPKETSFMLGIPLYHFITSSLF
jgi:hypothetical protein